jgi:glycosyltransferase involved in cell wall biosynthesis
MELESDGRPAFKKNLLVINYAVDERNQVFAHQTEAVIRLSKKFRKVYVITSTKGQVYLPNNVTVIESRWIQGKRIRNSLRFIGKFFQVYFRDKNIVIFSHMTEVQSALISPFTKIMGIRHIVWYAHASRSLAMNVNHFLLNGIASSTTGSCPYTGDKISIVGQAIDENFFSSYQRNFEPPYKFVHVGRTDPSKKIELIIKTIENLNRMGFDSSLTITGGPSSANSNGYVQSLEFLRESLENPFSIIFSGPIQRDLLPEYLKAFNLFIHAFQGSLDKSLIEATLLGIPVLTLNTEYLNIFGSWNLKPGSSLEEEFVALTSLSKDQINFEINRRRELAVSRHSLSGWVEKIYKLLLD